MNRRRLSACLLAVVVLCGGRQGPAQAQDLQPGQKIDPAFLEWPRVFATNGYEFAVYQPQVSKWQGNQLEGRFAAAARTAGTSNETYGVVCFTARTEIDKVNRLVTLEEFKVTKVEFPMNKAMQKEFLAIEPSLQAATAKVIPLDHLEAVFAASADISKQRIEPVKNDPPRVIYTTQPAVLVLVDGPPVFQPLAGDYQRVVNTRAVLLLNTNFLYQGNYLYGAGRWYKAPSLEGPWTVLPNPTPGLDTALAAAQATQEVDLLPPPDTNAPPLLQVYVSTVPAELIETSGVANMQSVADTDLLYVANTSNALFYCLDDASYYALLSGRWFKGKSLYGPWAFVPPGQLPPDFAKIPPDHEKSNVLASVPGTPQAREAVVANSIPQTATIERDKAKLEVKYAGAPGFAPVEGTSLQYATNTSTPVVMVNPTSYYACEGGVWFVSPSPNGPWAVATAVPSSIYTIPVSSPIHYVTYSYVYGATPNYVYVGYTPGYMGTVVAPGDVVVYGTGYYYPPVVVGAAYVGYPCTYGYGWGMALGLSVGFAFGYCSGWSSGCCYQPHWGCYYSSSYNCNYTHVNCNGTSYYYTHYGSAVHPTGSYGYNPYTGTAWHNHHPPSFNPYTGTTHGGGRGAAFNPYSGNYAAGHRGAFYNPYSGAHGAAWSGTAGHANSGNYGAGRQGAGYNPSTGSAAGYNRGVAGNANTGSRVAWNNGSVYAGRDGSVYRYAPNAGVQKYSGSTWQTVSRPVNSSPNQSAAPGLAPSTSGPSSGSSRTPAQSTWTSQGAAAQSTTAGGNYSSQSYWANHGSAAQATIPNRASSGQTAWGNPSSSAQYAGSSRAASGQSSLANGSRSAQSTAGYRAAQAQTSWPGRNSSAGYSGAGSGWSGSRGNSPVSSVTRESSARALGSQRFNTWQGSGGGGWGGSRGSGGGGGGGHR
jgi:hypothetical protein